MLGDDLLGADDTPVRLLDGTHPEGVRLARFWLFRGFAAAPYNIFRFHESRSRDGPREFLQNFRGVVKVDAYEREQRLGEKCRSREKANAKRQCFIACTLTLGAYNPRMSAAIRVSNLVKTYPGRPPVEAVRGVSLEVRRGECFGLLGPNGAGKTTTLEIIEGLLAPTSGEVEVLGRRWDTDDRAIRERIGISLQETRLPDKLTVRETVELFRSFYPSGISPDEAVAAVSLQEKTGSYVDRLSGGQKQRLAVACALVGDPEMLFLDEPTTGLDPQSRRELWDVVRAYKGRGRTVLITTHYMDEAERLCDRVAVIDHGKVIAIGAPSELILNAGGEHVIDLRLADDAGASPVSAEDLAQLPTVAAVRPAEGGFALSAAEPHTALPALLVLLQQKEITPTGLGTRLATLDDVFLALTGRHLRDGDSA